MKEIKTEATIFSAPDRIWKILIDISKWKDWNPIAHKIEGDTNVWWKIINYIQWLILKER